MAFGTVLVGLPRSVDPNGQTGGHKGLASDPWVPLRNIPPPELARLWGAWVVWSGLAAWASCC